ncbi:MAG: hypothetical protein JXA21_18355 [Anaerolineae bacterium]|nr:hypothetical protein [Anaerolineae bacterium]
MLKKIVYIVSLFTFVALLSGCDVISELLGKPTATPVLDLMPDLPDYTTVEGELLTEYIANLSEGAALLAAQPELVAAIAGVDQIIGCYQEIGVAKARIYSDKDNPLSAGVIAIADRNALLDPMNLFRCAQLKKEMLGRQSITIEPCVKTYTLEKDDNAFYVLYAGTTPDICQTFCDNLEGCVESK